MMHTDKREPFFSFGIGGSGSGVPFHTHGAGRYGAVIIESMLTNTSAIQAMYYMPIIFIKMCYNLL